MNDVTGWSNKDSRSETFFGDNSPFVRWFDCDDDDDDYDDDDDADDDNLIIGFNQLDNFMIWIDILWY